MTDLELAYLTGFFDGEGSVTIKVRAGTRFSTRHELEVRISQAGNNGRALLEHFCEVFGGSVKLVHQETSAHRATYNWVTGGARAGGLLKVLLPYLRLKRRQASLGIELSETFVHRGHWLAPELLAKRQKLREELLLLNRRGPANDR